MIDCIRIALAVVFWVTGSLFTQTSAAQEFNNSVPAYTQIPWQKTRTAKLPLELRSYALEIRDYMNAGELDVLETSMNYADFAVRQKGLLKSQLKPPVGREFSDGDISAITTELEKAIKNSLPSIFGHVSEWHLSSYRKYKNRHFLLYRADTEQDIFDYVDFEVAFKQDRWQVIDWYTHSTDTWASFAFSQTMAYVYNARMHPDETSRILLNYFTNRGNVPLEAFDALPESYRQNPYVLSTLVSFIEHVSPELMPEIIDRLVSLSAAEQFSLLKFSQAYEQDNYDLALQYLNRLLSRFDNDYQLSFVKAELLYRQGNKSKADKLMAKIIREHSQQEMVYYSALVLLAGQKRFPEALLVLDILKNDFDSVLDKDDLADIEGMKGFVESKVFVDWLKARS